VYVVHLIVKSDVKYIDSDWLAPSNRLTAARNSRVAAERSGENELLPIFPLINQLDFAKHRALNDKTLAFCFSFDPCCFYSIALFGDAYTNSHDVFTSGRSSFSDIILSAFQICHTTVHARMHLFLSVFLLTCRKVSFIET
jgi:hypothetical protein